MCALVRGPLYNYYLEAIRAKNKHRVTALQKPLDWKIPKTLCIEFVSKLNVCKQLEPYWTELIAEHRSYRNFSGFFRFCAGEKKKVFLSEQLGCLCLLLLCH